MCVTNTVNKIFVRNAQLKYHVPMDMTPEQLRFLREQQGMTREQLAAYLGDCTASTVNKWERGMHSIPAWVADKMFAKLPITFTVQELAEMYELCREEACTMSELIQDAVRHLIDQRRGQQTPNVTKFPQPPALDRAVEEPRDYKTGTED